MPRRGARPQPRRDRQASAKGGSARRPEEGPAAGAPGVSSSSRRAAVPMIDEDLPSEEEQHSGDEVGFVSSAKGLTEEDISRLWADGERIRAELEDAGGYDNEHLVAQVIVGGRRASTSYGQAVAVQEMLDAGVGSAWADESSFARDSLSDICLDADQVREARREEMSYVRRIPVSEEATWDACWAKDLSLRSGSMPTRARRYGPVELRGTFHPRARNIARTCLRPCRRSREISCCSGGLRASITERVHER